MFDFPEVQKMTPIFQDKKFEISKDTLNEDIGGMDISHVRHQDISSNSILNQMRDLDSIQFVDNDPQYLQTLNKALQNMIITSIKYE